MSRNPIPKSGFCQRNGNCCSRLNLAMTRRDAAMLFIGRPVLPAYAEMGRSGARSRSGVVWIISFAGKYGTHPLAPHTPVTLIDSQICGEPIRRAIPSSTEPRADARSRADRRVIGLSACITVGKPQSPAPSCSPELPCWTTGWALPSGPWREVFSVVVGGFGDTTTEHDRVSVKALLLLLERRSQATRPG